MRTKTPVIIVSIVGENQEFVTFNCRKNTLANVRLNPFNLNTLIGENNVANCWVIDFARNIFSDLIITARALTFVRRMN